MDSGQPRRRATLGCEGLQDSRRHAEQPGHGADAGHRAQRVARQDQGLFPGAGEDPLCGGGRRPGGFRHRATDRGALLHRAGRRSGGEEHDRHVLVPAQRDQRRPLAAAGLAGLHDAQGRGDRRRHDGRRHRLRVGAGRHRGGAQGCLGRGGREGQGVFRRPAGQEGRPWAAQRATARRRPRAHRTERGRRRLCRLRPDHRGGVRGPRAQGSGHRRRRSLRTARGADRLEYLDPADYRPGPGGATGGEVHRPALLQPGGQNAAGGDHPRRTDQRRSPGAGLRLCTADQENPHRRPRQPRLLHLAGVRHLHQRRHRHARRRRVGGDDREPGPPGRHAGRPAGDRR